MKSLQATAEEVTAALADSTELTVVTDEDKNIWIKRSKPLPPLRKKEKRNNKNNDDSGIGRDPHAVGYPGAAFAVAAGAAAAAASDVDSVAIFVDCIPGCFCTCWCCCCCALLYLLL